MTRMRNTQTGETGTLKQEPEDSRFRFMLYVDRDGHPDEPHELGYWEMRELTREGWAAVREPAVLMHAGARKYQPGTREFFEALGVPWPIRKPPHRELGQR